MKNIKMFAVFLVVAGFLTWTVAPAVAGRGCQSTTSSPMGAYEYPQAPGTKINASVAIHYTSDAMYVMAKAWRTDRTCAFSGIFPMSDYYSALDEQFGNIGLFFQDTVLPQVLGCSGDQCPQFCQPSSTEDCSGMEPYFSLKSTDDIFEQEWDQCGFYCCDFNFMFVDVVIAVVN